MQKVWGKLRTYVYSNIGIWAMTFDFYLCVNVFPYNHKFAHLFLLSLESARTKFVFVILDTLEKWEKLFHLKSRGVGHGKQINQSVHISFRRHGKRHVPLACLVEVHKVLYYGTALHEALSPIENKTSKILHAIHFCFS